jgi:tetrahydromethanopterin S-methyltransferase subunit G
MYVNNIKPHTSYSLSLVTCNLLPSSVTNLSNLVTSLLDSGSSCIVHLLQKIFKLKITREDKKMKTTNNHNSAVKMATILFAVVVFSTTAWAQQKTGSDNSSVNEVVERLDVLANKIEKEIRYEAPSVETAEYNESMTRLEMLANKIEKEIRYEAPSVETTDYIESMARLEKLANKIENEVMYKAPGEEQVNAVEFAAAEDNTEKENNELLTFNSDPSNK